MKGIDALAVLLDVLGDGIGQQFVDDFLQLAARNVPVDDLYHLLADGANLATRSVTEIF